MNEIMFSKALPVAKIYFQLKWEYEFNKTQKENYL